MAPRTRSRRTRRYLCSGTMAWLAVGLAAGGGGNRVRGNKEDQCAPL